MKHTPPRSERPLTLRQAATAALGQLHRSNRSGVTDGSEPPIIAATAFAAANVNGGDGLKLIKTDMRHQTTHELRRLASHSSPPGTWFLTRSAIAAAKWASVGDRLIVTPRDLVATIATRSVSQRPGRDYPPKRILVGWKDSGHAALPFWLYSNSVPLIHIACIMIASFLATATAARLKPLRL